MEHKISLIIPMYNNPHQLERLLNYYNSYNVNYSIIIADSSLEQNQMLIKKTIALFPNLSLTYLAYSSTILPAYKLADAINYAKSPYSLICASDDFTTPSGIQKCAAFLENNPDFTVAIGYCATFNIKKNQNKEQLIYWWEQTPTAISLFQNRSIKFEDSVSRFTYYLSTGPYADVFYGVYRTDSLKMFLKETAKYTLIDDYRFSDILPPLLAIIHGKLQLINVFYSAREISPVSASYAQKTFSDFIKDNTFNKRYSLFKTCLINHLCATSQITKADAEKLIDKMMAYHLRRLYPKGIKYQTRKILRHLPMYEKIKLLLLKLRIKGVNYMDSLTIRDGTPYYDEIIKIRDNLLTYNTYGN